MTRTIVILERYGRFVSKKPFTLLLITLMLTLVAFAGMSILKSESMDMSDMLPKNRPVVESLNYLGDEFGSYASGMVVIEIDPTLNGSNEARDIRDANVMEYADVLTQKIRNIDSISTAQSIADIIKDSNNGRIPQNEKTIREVMEKSGQASRYVGSDYTMSLIRFTLTDDADDETLAEELEKILEQTPIPPGIKTGYTGSFAISVAIQRQIIPDMQNTTIFSLIGILFLMYVVFRSIRYSINALTAIIFGTLWAFGMIGILGMPLSSVTSGAASMIMGIGIDFGIQVVSRFRQELTRGPYDIAMIKTISGVTIPMTTTTLAALVGFRAMSLGELSLMGELGTMMSFGVLFCMIAALTIIPALLIIYEKRFNSKTREGELNENSKK